MRLLHLQLARADGQEEPDSASLAPGLTVVALPDPVTRDVVSAALFACLGAETTPRVQPDSSTSAQLLPTLRVSGPRPRTERRKRVFAPLLQRQGAHLPAAGPKGLQPMSSSLAYEESDGRSFRVTTDLTAGYSVVVDVDTGERNRFERAPVPGGLSFDVLEAFVRIKAPDAQVASMGPDHAMRAFRKCAMSAGVANLLGVLAARTADALAGRTGTGWEPPLPSPGPRTLLRALEADIDRGALRSRELDHRLQSLHALRRRKEATLARLRDERTRCEYLLLRLVHKRTSQKVGRIDDLLLQLDRLSTDPVPAGAESALELWPKVERLIAALEEVRAEIRDLLRRAPSDTSPEGAKALATGPHADSSEAHSPGGPHIEALEAEYSRLQEELSLLGYAPPVGPDLEMVVRKVYEEWRRLSAEAEAAEFAASQARLDARELADDPSEEVARLSRVTTADKLRARLRARLAAAHDLEAAQRERRDTYRHVADQLVEAGSSVAQAIGSRRAIYTSISRLASIEDAHEARREAEKTAALVPKYRPFKKKAAWEQARRLLQVEKWLLAEEGVSSVEDFRRELEEGCKAAAALKPLEEATFEVAGLAARLALAEEDLAECTGGLVGGEGSSVRELATLVDDLEAHQMKVAAVAEIEREAELAAEVARSLKAARDAAAAELLARLRPLGITDSDPAMAWSRFQLLVEGWRKKEQIEDRLSELEARLEPVVEFRKKLAECRSRQDDVSRRLAAVLSRVEGCESGSLDERVANFVRLRDAGLLERKLATARRHLESQLQEVCKGKTPQEWRDELFEVEARLSELEAEHPHWKELEVASPEAVIQEQLRGIELQIRQMETSLAAVEADIAAARSEAASRPDSYRERLQHVRSQLSKLDSLAEMWSRLRIAEDLLYLESGSEQAVAGAWAVAATAGSSSVKALPARAIAAGTPREECVSKAAGRRGPAASPLLSQAQVPSTDAMRSGLGEPRPQSGSSLVGFILARAGLSIACAPDGHHLPLVIDGALDHALPYEKEEAMQALDRISAATQVVVLTSDPDVEALARSAGVRVEAMGLSGD